MTVALRSAPRHEPRDLVERRFGDAAAVTEAYFAEHAQAIAACASAMADRFFEGGRLLVFGTGAATSDAQHNSVEYVHPVLPGCRALPALSLTNDVATVSALLMSPDPGQVFSHQLDTLGRPGDIALAFVALPAGEAVTRGLAAAARRGMLTVALVAGVEDPGEIAEHRLHVRSADHELAQEAHLATYHVLWELVHIVLNHRGIPEGPRSQGGDR